MIEFGKVEVPELNPVNDNGTLNRSEMAILRTLFAEREEEDATITGITSEYSVRISRCLYRPVAERSEDDGQAEIIYTVIHNMYEEGTNGVFITSWDIGENGRILEGFCRYVQDGEPKKNPLRSETDLAETIAHFPFPGTQTGTFN